MQNFSWKINGLAPSLALKQRLGATRKWRIMREREGERSDGKGRKSGETGKPFFSFSSNSHHVRTLICARSHLQSWTK